MSLNTKRMDPRKQFSKWLAKFGAIIWAIYALATIPLIAYRPEAAMACVWLLLIMTGNKALDTLAYTDNSKTEKILLAALDKIQMQMSLKGVAQNVITTGMKAVNGTKTEGTENEKGTLTGEITDEMADVMKMGTDMEDMNETAEVNG